MEVTVAPALYHYDLSMEFTVAPALYHYDLSMEFTVAPAYHYTSLGQIQWHLLCTIMSMEN